MSKLIVNEIEKYDAGQLTITTGTNVSMGGNLTITGNLAVDTNTLYVDAANNRVGFGTSTPYAAIQAVGTIKVATGNAQGILALGDGAGTTVNAGIWRGAANNPTSDGNFLNLGGYDGIVLATGNAAIGSQTERMRINSSGRVGIGESTPSGALHIKVASDTSDIVLESSGGSGRKYAINSRTDGSFTIYDATGSSERMRIDSSGNVSIGGTGSEKLNVFGSGSQFINVKNTSTNADMFVGMSSGLAAGYIGTGGSDPMVIATANTERMRIDSSGNVGIGTASPASYTGFTVLSIGSGTNGGVLNIQKAGTSYANISADNNNLTLDSVVNTQSIVFRTGVGTTERMRIDSSGNVLINTQTNQFGEKLTVSGFTTNVSGSVVALTGSDSTVSIFGSYSNHPVVFRTNNTERMRIDSSGRVGIGQVPDREFNLTYTSDNCVMAIKAGTSRVAGVVFGDNDDDDKGAVLYNNASDYLYLSSNGSERMRIDSSGNVGIGTIPSYNLHNTGSFGFATNITGNIGVFGSNTATADTYFRLQNSAGAYDVGTSATGHYLYGQGSLPLQFFTNATERMRIDSSGNVGIGISNPADYAYTNLVVGNTSSDGGVTIVSGTSSVSRLLFADGSTAPSEYIGGIQYHHSDNSMRLYTNDSERMRITSGGALKASTGGTYLNSGAVYHELRQETNSQHIAFLSNTGTSAPQGVQIRFTGAAPNNTSSRFLDCEDSSTNAKFIIYSNGDVVNTNNSYGAISDAKLKENITDASPKLDNLLQVKVRNFNYIGDDKKQLGVVAQELEEVFPSMIDESPDFEEQEVTDEEGNVTKERVDLGTTTKSVKYSVFVPMLIKAIQELNAKVEALESQLNA